MKLKLDIYFCILFVEVLDFKLLCFLMIIVLKEVFFFLKLDFSILLIMLKI